MAKATKKRAEKYEQKLSIEGSFEDVIKLSSQPLHDPKPAPKKKAAKKKAAKKK
jgi:hypothetical protein